jgi:four helix bundle protein
MPIQNYRGLDVWQCSMDLLDEIYVVTRKLPSDERYVLVSQMRRAALSVPSNLAEGYGRKHRGEYVHHVSIAIGSLCELETQLIVCGRQKYISKAEARKAWDFIQRVGKMLHKLLSSLAD